MQNESSADTKVEFVKISRRRTGVSDHQFLHTMEEPYKRGVQSAGVPENFLMKRSGCCLEKVPGGQE